MSTTNHERNRTRRERWQTKRMDALVLARYGVPTVEEWSREGIEASPLALQWEKRGRPKGLPPGASDERIG